MRKFEMEFDVGAYHVTMHVNVVDGKVTRILSQWEPDVPDSLTTQEWQEYTTARNVVLTEVSRALEEMR